MKKGKKKRPQFSNRKASALVPSVRGRLEQASAAFTLIELLLTVVLILLLFGAAVFNFGSLRPGSDLNEGAARLETFIRLGRAHAAESGCKVQLFFAEATTNETSALQLRWEPEPLAQPGTWVSLTGGLWDAGSLNQMIRVVSAQDPSSRPLPDRTVGTDEAAMVEQTPITFYPDGTSDSSEIVLASRNEEDPRRVVIQIIGFTGSLNRRLLSSETDLPPVPALAAQPSGPSPEN